MQPTTAINNAVSNYAQDFRLQQKPPTMTPQQQQLYAGNPILGQGGADAQSLRQSHHFYKNIESFSNPLHHPSLGPKDSSQQLLLEDLQLDSHNNNNLERLESMERKLSSVLDNADSSNYEQMFQIYSNIINNAEIAHQKIALNDPLRKQWYKRVLQYQIKEKKYRERVEIQQQKKLDEMQLAAERARQEAAARAAQEEQIRVANQQQNEASLANNQAMAMKQGASNQALQQMQQPPFQGNGTAAPYVNQQQQQLQYQGGNAQMMDTRFNPPQMNQYNQGGPYQNQQQINNYQDYGATANFQGNINNRQLNNGYPNQNQGQYPSQYSQQQYPQQINNPQALNQVLQQQVQEFFSSITNMIADTVANVGKPSESSGILSMGLDNKPFNFMDETPKSALSANQRDPRFNDNKGGKHLVHKDTDFSKKRGYHNSHDEIPVGGQKIQNEQRQGQTSERTHHKNNVEHHGSKERRLNYQQKDQHSQQYQHNEQQDQLSPNHHQHQDPKNISESVSNAQHQNNISMSLPGHSQWQKMRTGANSIQHSAVYGHRKGGLQTEGSLTEHDIVASERITIPTGRKDQQVRRSKASSNFPGQSKWEHPGQQNHNDYQHDHISEQEHEDETPQNRRQRQQLGPQGPSPKHHPLGRNMGIESEFNPELRQSNDNNTRSVPSLPGNLSRKHAELTRKVSGDGYMEKKLFDHLNEGEPSEILPNHHHDEIHSQMDQSLEFNNNMHGDVGPDEDIAKMKRRERIKQNHMKRLTTLKNVENLKRSDSPFLSHHTFAAELIQDTEGGGLRQNRRLSRDGPSQPPFSAELSQVQSQQHPPDTPMTQITTAVTTSPKRHQPYQPNSKGPNSNDQVKRPPMPPPLDPQTFMKRLPPEMQNDPNIRRQIMDLAEKQMKIINDYKKDIERLASEKAKYESGQNSENNYQSEKQTNQSNQRPWATGTFKNGATRPPRHQPPSKNAPTRTSNDQRSGSYQDRKTDYEREQTQSENNSEYDHYTEQQNQEQQQHRQSQQNRNEVKNQRNRSAKLDQGYQQKQRDNEEDDKYFRQEPYQANHHRKQENFHNEQKDDDIRQSYHQNDQKQKIRANVTGTKTDLVARLKQQQSQKGRNYEGYKSIDDNKRNRSNFQERRQSMDTLPIAEDYPDIGATIRQQQKREEEKEQPQKQGIPLREFIGRKNITSLLTNQTEQLFIVEPMTSLPKTALSGYKFKKTLAEEDQGTIEDMHEVMMHNAKFELITAKDLQWKNFDSQNEIQRISTLQSVLEQYLNVQLQSEFSSFQIPVLSQADVSRRLRAFALQLLETDAIHQIVNASSQDQLFEAIDHAIRELGLDSMSDFIRTELALQMKLKFNLEEAEGGQQESRPTGAVPRSLMVIQYA